MPQASERLLATPKINPRLPRSRPPPSTMTRLEHRCWDGDRAGSGSTNAVLRLKGNAEIPGSRLEAGICMVRPPMTQRSPPFKRGRMRPAGGGNTGNPRVFFHHAAMHCDRLRSLARRPARSPLGDADAPQMAGPEAGGRDIERALAALVEDQRSALLLVVLEGLSYREVAEVQGVPIGTVMSRLARARAQIKSYLDGERPALRRIK